MDSSPLERSAPGADLRLAGCHRVIVANGASDTVDSVRALLTPPGFDVVWEAEVSEAAALVARERHAQRSFAIAFVALREPGESGRELVRLLHEADPDLQVVVQTGGALEPWTLPCGEPPRHVAFVEDTWDIVPMREFARILAEKWMLLQACRRKRGELDGIREKASLLDKVPDAIFVQDLDGCLLSWNPGAERLYGLPAQDVLGTRIQSQLGGEGERMAECLRLTLESGTWSGEYTQRHADGHELTVESCWTLVRDERDEPKSLLIINTDVTVKKQLELKSIRAQRLETIGTLAAGIAHDLNNALQPIAMAVDVFRSALTDPKSQNLLNLVGRNAERAAGLVREVLSFASSVEGERHLIHPVALMGEIANAIRNTFPKSIEFRMTPVEEPWLLLGDSTQLCQALLQLCLNARDAMPEGGILTLGVKNIHIDAHFASLHSDAAAGNFIVVAVTDTGVGVPDALREKVFDPFFTTKAPGMGSGTGLSTALTIVRSHGGFLTLNSREGRGTTIRIFLPAVKKEGAPASDRERQTRNDPAASETAGNGEGVLLVDDEAAVLTVMRIALENAGYRVFTAADGAEGLRAYDHHRDEIGLVLTDMVMPVMDGPGMIAEIKQANGTAKIVAMTGMSTKAGIDAVKRLGVRRILSKPCSSRVMLAAVREELES